LPPSSGSKKKFQQDHQVRGGKQNKLQAGNWCIYRKQKVSGKWSLVLIGWSDEVVNTRGLRACLLFALWFSPWEELKLRSL
jgi:hypothetical protein